MLLSAFNEEGRLTSTDEVEFEACPEPAQSVATLPTESFRVDMVAADIIYLILGQVNNEGDCQVKYIL